jgi:methyl-accepting chemotaxis protein
MSEKNESRRKIFINKAFQGRFILNVLLLLLMSFFCSALMIYWLTGGDLMAESQSAHASIEDSLKHLGASIFIGNLVAILVAGVGILFLVLYASHKIAGPMFRFEKLCQHIGDGQLDTITKLRKDDQLQDMGRAFEDMVIKLRERRDVRAKTVEKLHAELDNIQKNQAHTSDLSGQVEEMRRLLMQLRD